MTLKDYRSFSLKQLKEMLKTEEESRTYWLKSMNGYDDKENGHYDGYNYNRCRNEALKIETQIKRIEKVIKEKSEGNE